MLGAELFGNLPRADLFNECRERLAQFLCLPPNLRAHEEEERNQQDDQQKVNNCDRSPAAMHQFFQTGYRWVNQVSKQHREQESLQSAVRHVEESQRQDEQ